MFIIFKGVVLSLLLFLSFTISTQDTQTKTHKSLAIVIACGLPVFVWSGLCDVDRGMNQVHLIDRHIHVAKQHLKMAFRHTSQITKAFASGSTKIILSSIIGYYVFKSLTV